MRGVVAAYYREVLNYRRRIGRFLLSSIINPLLFLIAFGYGLSSFVLSNSLEYLRFMIPGLIAVSTMNQAYSVSFDIHISRLYTYTYQGLLIAPVKRWELVVGEVLFGITKSLPPIIFFTFYILFFHNCRLSINLLFFIGCLIHVVIWSLVGVVVAFMVDSHADHAAITTFVINPLAFVSDTFFPVEKLNSILYYISYLSPLTHTTRMIRYSMQGVFNGFYSELPVTLTVLLIFATIAIIVVSRAES